MKILDRYIFLEFFRSFLGTLLLLTGIGVISKVMERLSVLIAYDGPFGDILKFVYLNIPYIITIVGPTALMFAISFTIANFSKKKELAVIMTSGRSFRRILAPIIFFALLYSFFSFFLTEYVSFPWYRESLDHYHEVLKQKNYYRKGTRSNYHARIGDRFLYVGQYNDSYNMINSLHIVEFIQNHPDSVIESDYAIIIPKMWILLNGTVTKFNPDTSIKEHSSFKSMTVPIPEGREFLKTHATTFEEKNIFQLKKEMDERKKHGGKFRKHLVELYWHYSVPFVSLFIVMIAGILGSQVKKGAMSLSISISTMITLVYYFLMYMGKSLAVSGVFSPFFGAWSANIVFTLLSIYFFSKYRI